MTPDERLAAALRFSPEMCSLNMGSMNFSFHGMGAKIADWQLRLGEQYIEDSETFIFRNTFRDIARIYQLLAEHGTRFEHECYDIGHLYNLAHFARQGLGEAAVLHPERVRYSGRHRRRPRQRRVHAANRRPPVRQ